MKRGDMYLLRRPGSRDPKKQRVMTVVSRQALVDSRFPTVVCAPLFTRGHGLETEVSVGREDGLKHPSWILAATAWSASPRAGLPTSSVASRPRSSRASRTH